MENTELIMKPVKGNKDLSFSVNSGESLAIIGPTGSGGVNLSGGQKQRLSIARGILKKSSCTDFR